MPALRTGNGRERYGASSCTPLRFPELRAKRANMLLLCHACHKEIHCNPYLNIKLMEEKAAELEIKLSERYNFTKE